MTLPRRVVAGATYLITRRCLDRRFYLRPSRELNDIYLYSLALAQAAHGIEVHALAAMSDHHHDTLTDPRGVLPDFLRDFHRAVALGAKELYGIHGNVWANETASAVELHGATAQLDAVLYTTLNPVRAGLVPRAATWPGAIWIPGQRFIDVRRPRVWFSKNLPDVLRIHITPPPAWNGTEDDWHEFVGNELARNEGEIARERREARKPFLGRERVLRQRPFDRPRNPDEIRPSRNPRVSTGGDGALMSRVLSALRQWRRAYKEAWESWRVDKSVVFPIGTWWAVRHAGAALA